MNIGVRDVDVKIFRKFKAEAVKEGLKTGTALTQALNFWLEKKEMQKKKSKIGLLDLPSWDWGKGNENASQEIDEVLYGGKK
ncbi:MAG: hypothetical protein ABIA76_02270 [Candidatus Diapherotrites archaeon]